MRALYEIDSDIAQCFDMETGEILDESALEALEVEWNEKVEAVGVYAKTLRAEAEAIENERTNLLDRALKKKAKALSLENWIARVLDGRKFETPKVAVTFRKSDTVIVDNVEALPEEFQRVKHSVEANKTEIKKALKAGIAVPGCVLETHNNISIK